MSQLTLNHDISKVCAICYGQIDDVRPQSCKTCESKFHNSHLQLWLLSNNTCPVCHYQFDRETKVIPLSFITENRIFRDPTSNQMIKLTPERFGYNRHLSKQIAKYHELEPQSIQLGNSGIGLLQTCKELFRSLDRNHLLFILTFIFNTLVHFWGYVISAGNAEAIYLLFVLHLHNLMIFAVAYEVLGDQKKTQKKNRKQFKRLRILESMDRSN